MSKVEYGVISNPYFVLPDYLKEMAEYNSTNSSQIVAYFFAAFNKSTDSAISNTLARCMKDMLQLKKAQGFLVDHHFDHVDCVPRLLKQYASQASNVSYLVELASILILNYPFLHFIHCL